MSKNKIFILIATIILCFAGFNNKYPLLTENSGAYISAGFEKQFAYGVSYVYGLFVKHSSWASSLWLTILTQAFIAAVLLFFVFRSFIKNKAFIYFYLSFIVISTFILPGSFAISTIDPGIFSAFTILGFILVLFSDKEKSRNLYIILFLLLFACISSVTNLLAGTLILIGYIVLLPFYKMKFFSLTRIIMVVSVVMGSWITYSLINKAISGSYSPLSNMEVQFLPRLNGNGYVKEYLIESNRNNSELYLYKDSLDVLFAAKSMYKDPFLSEGRVRDYQDVSKSILEQPNFLASFSADLAKDYGTELISFDIQNQLDIKYSVPVLKSMFRFYNDEVREVYLARQVGKYMDLKVKDTCQHLVVFLVIISLLFLLLKQKNGLVLFLITGVMLFTFINVLFYGASHLQWYYSWLLPLPLFIYIGENYNRSNIKQIITKLKRSLN
nr:hypothetical protein [uncultured Carboxylicivirga sp.]